MAQTDTSLSPAPVTTPVSGDNGLLTLPWLLFFQKLQQRVGGITNTPPLNVTNGTITALQTDVTDVKATQAAQQSTLTAVQAQQATDHAALTALENELATDSGTWTPTFTGATITGAVTVTARWKSIAELLFFDVEIDATAGSIAFAGASMDVPVPASAAGAFTAVSASPFADHGNGAVLVGTALIPNFTISGGLAAFSGRYLR